ncbi:MAG TPA: N-acetyltransferase [Thermodesulfobacteriota bacterium]|nr:N-acetyltransferase [Deltaproteobacteria bacterium]HNR12361.1 N-acetyltransferase [Thermodesulfobacteriota bacterium]HNU70448.1 N-acetyltransferase [Thermodesulfobacteriota bacterium]HQO79254.1 N-acetyltransferase [Thermodesulfobacteriota bacterium]
MIIRNETNSDVGAIAEVTKAAFKNLLISNHTEQFIVPALRQANALTLSLVAERDGQVVGHIAFSPVTISDRTPDWHGLGPMAVLPEYQRQGIGKRLIQEGLYLLKSQGSKGCIMVGDPLYYQRFGFRNVPGLIHNGVPEEALLAIPFAKTVPQGIVIFHEGFLTDGCPPFWLRSGGGPG